MSQRWKPIYQTYALSKRTATVEDRRAHGNRIKFTHQCAKCGGWFPKKMVEVDHIVPCGTLKDIATDAGPFILRMLCEADGLRLLCNPCHLEVTNAEDR